MKLDRRNFIGTSAAIAAAMAAPTVMASGKPRVVVVGGGAGGAGTAGTSSNAGPAGIGSFIADTFIGPTAPSYGETGPEGRFFAGGGGGKGMKIVYKESEFETLSVSYTHLTLPTNREV